MKRLRAARSVDAIARVVGDHPRARDGHRLGHDQPGEPAPRLGRQRQREGHDAGRQQREARPVAARRRLRVSHQPEPAPISTLTVASSVLCVIASQTIAAAVAPLMATRRKA